jgi:peptide/nickel transport system permease protein
VLAYFVRKLLLAIPLLWGVVTLTFLLIELIPGDYCDAMVSPELDPDTIEVMRANLGCDDPVWERYVTQVAALASGDLGESRSQHRPVSTIVGEALPNTLVLALVTIVVGQTFGVLVGILQSVRQHRWEDTSLAVVTLFFFSMPGFWLALMLQLIFALHWKLLPSSGMIDAAMYDFMGPADQLRDRLVHLVLPGLAMGIASAAGDARYMRSSMLEVIRQDFIRTARAKGLPEWRVVLKHALRNALLPMVTLLGINLPYLFSGSVLVETVFAWPGMGRLIVDAVNQQDAPVIMGCFLVFTVLVVLGNLASDLLYTIVDPRIRFA